MTVQIPSATNGDLIRDISLPETTRTIQGRSCPDEAPQIAKHKALGWATSFGATKHIGFEAGSMFVNPFHKSHEGGNEVYFAAVQIVYAMP